MADNGKSMLAVENLPLEDAVRAWSADEAAELYNLDGWSDGYFRIESDGSCVVDRTRSGDRGISIRAVADELKARGIPFPVLIRFQDVLSGRVQQINEAFRQSIEEIGYRNRYVGVYPIKVNQLHEVVEEVLTAGRPYDMGLECGSKSELVAALPHLESDDTLLICNGYKDRAMIALIVALQQIGKHVIPVVEKFDEFETLMEVGKERDALPQFGVRVRLSASGAGKWADSGGDLSKFGVSVTELLKIHDRLEAAGSKESLALLHFHLGSQISDIQALRRGTKEISQTYVQLKKRGMPVRYVDVGGGLGVNYEGDLSGGENSINYSLKEYTNAIVQTIKDICDNEKVDHPVIISESGRAITAHHSVLVLEVLGSYSREVVTDGFTPEQDDHRLVHELSQTLDWIKSGDVLRPAELLEAYHDAVSKRQEADALFGFGYYPLEQKALSDQLFWTVCAAIHDRLRSVATDWLPDELAKLPVQLVDQYLCNFSVFQSMLDHWAIGQHFPIMPLHRLDERPTRRSVLMDLTCDSDGKVDGYVTSNDERGYLDLHELRNGDPYYLGVFLMGAYQDIMGDSHNLFGRVAEAHVYADDNEVAGYYIEKVIDSTSVQEMLALVQYFPSELQKRMEIVVKSKVEAGVLKPAAGSRLLDEYRACLTDSTYLQR